MIGGVAVPSPIVIDVRLSWLRTFVAVAEERHFGRAAARVGHSDSAVSRHIRQLEAAVAGPLFERTTRVVALTARGRRLYLEVAPAVESLTGALSPADHPSLPIVVGYVGAASEHLVPAMAARWSLQSDVELRLVPASSAAQLDAIRDGTIDVGLQWHGPSPGDELASEPLLTEPMRVAVPLSHAAAEEGDADLGELASETWLMAADRTDLVVREHLVASCRASGFVPRIKDAATGHAAQLHLVAAGRGICLVPRTALRDCRLPVSFLRIRNEQVRLVAVTGSRPRPHVAELVRMLQRTASLEPRVEGT
jgi:DNA-binding transcriptional LysR family regulator